MERMWGGRSQREGKKCEGVHAMPAGPWGLLNCPASGQGSAAIEDSDIIQAEKSALENVHAVGVLAIHPPSEVQQQLVKNPLQKCPVALAMALLIDLVYAPCRPGVHWRIHFAQRPLVSRNLSVGMHLPLAQHQCQLLLGEIRVDQ